MILKILRIFLSLVLILSSCLEGSNSFSLMTWNILGPNSPDAELHFPVSAHMTWAQNSRQRFKRIVAEINSKMPDILCLQETSLRTHAWLVQAGLNQVYELGSFCPKGKFNGALVLYHKHRFDKLNEASCRLSHDGAAACVALKSKLSAASIIVCSVHISRSNGRSDMSKGLLQIQECLQCFTHQFRSIVTTHTPCVLAGDFNAYYQEVLDYVDGRGFLGSNWHMIKHNSFTASSPQSRMQPISDALTINHKLPFTVRCDSKFVSIDHILFSNLIQIAPSIVGNGGYINPNVSSFTGPQYGSSIQPLVQHVYPSDHLPVFTMFQFLPSVMINQRTTPSSSAAQLPFFVRLKNYLKSYL